MLLGLYDIFSSFLFSRKEKMKLHMFSIAACHAWWKTSFVSLSCHWCTALNSTVFLLLVWQRNALEWSYMTAVPWERNKFSLLLARAISPLPASLLAVHPLSSKLSSLFCVQGFVLYNLFYILGEVIKGGGELLYLPWLWWDYMTFQWLKNWPVMFFCSQTIPYYLWIQPWCTHWLFYFHVFFYVCHIACPSRCYNALLPITHRPTSIFFILERTVSVPKHCCGTHGNACCTTVLHAQTVQ